MARNMVIRRRHSEYLKVLLVLLAVWLFCVILVFNAVDSLKMISDYTYFEQSSILRNDGRRSSGDKVNSYPYEHEQIWPKWNEQDRILDQLKLNRSTGRVMTIFVGIRTEFDYVDRFKKDQCPVQDCVLVTNANKINSVDVILSNRPRLLRERRPWQLSVWYNLESPMSPTTDVIPNKLKITWTATYRQHSIINTPYERFTLFTNYTRLSPKRNYAKGKTKMVAWFVSNCITQNGRLAYAKELHKHMPVDIYGVCGTRQCSQGSPSCSKLLSKRYKFYLAFENSNCVDYITEKLYWNALRNDVIPIVMGARPEDYHKVAPPHSFIHVDNFESPRHLADYLTILNQNDTLYNEYFQWKGTGSYIDTKFWCRLCSMVHETEVTKTNMYYSGLRKWWSGEGTCIEVQNNMTWASWRNRPRKYDYLDPKTVVYL